MAFQSKRRSPGSASAGKAPEMAPCITCGESVPAAAVHCSGSKIAYGCLSDAAHHGSQLWPDCWKCGGAMGCTDCVPGGRKKHFKGAWTNADLICRRCRVKVTLESLLNGGPISRFSLSIGQDGRQSGWHEAKGVPTINAYPKPWISAYDEQCAIQGRSAHEDEEPYFRLLMTMLARVKKSKPMEIASRRELQVERNRQVRQLTEANHAVQP